MPSTAVAADGCRPARPRRTRARRGEVARRLAGRGGDQHGRRALGVGAAAARSRPSSTSATAAWRVTVYFGTRKGSASTADLSAGALRETVAKACSIARFTAEDPCAGIADPDTLARDIPDLDLAHPWDVTPERACEHRARVRGGGARGRCRASPIPRARASARIAACAPTAIRTASSRPTRAPCTASAARWSAPTGEEMERDYWYSTARDWRELEAAASVGRTAGERAVRRLGARQLGDDARRRCSTRPTWRAGSSATSSARSAAAASTGARRSCSTRPASRCSRTGSRCRSGRTCRARWRARRSTTRASRRATANW